MGSGSGSRSRVASGVRADFVAYRHLIRAKVRSEAKYPVSFVSHLVAQTLILGLDLLAIWVLFQQVPTLGGWTSRQVLYLYGISGTAFGLADIFVSAIERTTEYVRLGTFDRFLLRPMSTLIQLEAQEFELRRIGRVIQPVVVLIASLLVLHVHWTIGRALLVPFSLLGGFVFFAGLYLITCSTAFFVPSTQEFANAFTYGGQMLTQYPVHLFGEWLRRIALFIVPLGVVAYLPGIYVLQAPNPLGVAPWMQVGAPLVSLPVLGLGLLAWRAGERHYSSTGS